MNNNSSIWELISILLFLFLLLGVLLGFGVGTLKENSCSRNPLNYGISQLENENLKVTCSCYFNNNHYSPFFFNKTGIFSYSLS